jgi:hypothetical protein
MSKYTLEKVVGWCEKNCGNILNAVCWEKFLDVKIEGLKNAEAPEIQAFYSF